MARYLSGLVASYLRCPVVRESQLHTEISLSSTQSECIALSQSLLKTTPTIDILKGMKSLGYNVSTVSPNVLCKLFEDNSRALTLSQDPATIPRTNNNNVKYHQFRAYFANYTIHIILVDLSNQPSDMLMHLLNEDSFFRHRRSIMEWQVLKEFLTR